MKRVTAIASGEGSVPKKKSLSPPVNTLLAMTVSGRKTSPGLNVKLMNLDMSQGCFVGGVSSTKGHPETRVLINFVTTFEDRCAPNRNPPLCPAKRRHLTQLSEGWLKGLRLR